MKLEALCHRQRSQNVMRDSGLFMRLAGENRINQPQPGISSSFCLYGSVPNHIQI